LCLSGLFVVIRHPTTGQLRSACSLVIAIVAQSVKCMEVDVAFFLLSRSTPTWVHAWRLLQRCSWWTDAKVEVSQNPRGDRLGVFQVASVSLVRRICATTFSNGYLKSGIEHWSLQLLAQNQNWFGLQYPFIDLGTGYVPKITLALQKYFLAKIAVPSPDKADS